MSSNTKDLRQEVRKAKRRGWIIEDTDSNHLKWVWPHGGAFFYSAQTPSDFRAIKNIRANYRKIELSNPAPIEEKLKVEIVKQIIAASPIKVPSETFKIRVRNNKSTLFVSLPERYRGETFDVVFADGKLIVARCSKTAGCTCGRNGDALGLQMSARKWVPDMPICSFKTEVTMENDSFVVDVPQAEAARVQPVDNAPALPNRPRSLITRDEIVKAVVLINTYCQTTDYRAALHEGHLKLTRMDVIG